MVIGPDGKVLYQKEGALDIYAVRRHILASIPEIQLARRARVFPGGGGADGGEAEIGVNHGSTSRLPVALARLPTGGAGTRPPDGPVQCPTG